MSEAVILTLGSMACFTAGYFWCELGKWLWKWDD